MTGGQVVSAMVLSWDERLLLNRYQAVWGVSLIALSMIGFASFGELEFDQWLGLWVGGALVALAIFWGCMSARLSPFRTDHSAG